MDGDSKLLHATAIAVDGRAALLLGASGKGKSDLALRCLMTAAYDGAHQLRAQLVSDDQVMLRCKQGRLVASAPTSIAGILEVRGLGILPFPHVAEALVALAVALDSSQTIERLPDPMPSYTELGVHVPLLRLAPFEASAALKVLLTLGRLPAIRAP